MEVVRFDSIMVPAGGITNIIKTIVYLIFRFIPTIKPTIKPIEIDQTTISRPAQGLDKAPTTGAYIANPSSIHTKLVWL